MMKFIVVTLMFVVVGVLLNLKNIMAEVSLSTRYVASDEERAWVDGFRSHPNVPVVDGAYRFVRTYSNGDTMDVTYHIDVIEQLVIISGTITSLDFTKDIFALAHFKIDGAVIDYHDAKGHVQLFPDAGHVLTRLPDNKLNIRSQDISLTSL